MDDEQKTPFVPAFRQPPAITQGEAEPERPRFQPEYRSRPALRPAQAEPEPPRFMPAYQGRGGVTAQLANRGQVPSVTLREWRGMFSNANPHVIGTQYLREQVNLTSAITGQLQVRSGLRAVAFDSE